MWKVIPLGKWAFPQDFKECVGQWLHFSVIKWWQWNVMQWEIAFNIELFQKESSADLFCIKEIEQHKSNPVNVFSVRNVSLHVVCENSPLNVI